MTGRCAAGALAILLMLVPAAGFAQEGPADPPREPDIWPEQAVSDEEAAGQARAVLPLTQEQIENFGRLSRQTRDATARGAGPPPEGRIRLLRASLTGDRSPPVIAVTRGYATVLSFTDMTGAPWPIEKVVVDQRFLPVQEGEPEAESHLVYLVAQDDHANGNIAVKLKGLPAPLTAALRAGSRLADFRVDIRVPGAGPNADPEALAEPVSFHAGDSVLLDLLTGRIPADAEPLLVEGGDYRDRAWRLGGDVLLLTPRLLLAPGPLAVEHGSNGRRGYRLAETPIVTVIDNGRERRLSLRPSEIRGEPAAASVPTRLPAVNVEPLGDPPLGDPQ